MHKSQSIGQGSCACPSQEHQSSEDMEAERQGELCLAAGLPWSGHKTLKQRVRYGDNLQATYLQGDLALADSTQLACPVCPQSLHVGRSIPVTRVSMVGG